MIEKDWGPADPFRCSLCSRNANEVRMLFTRSGYNICDGCLEICEQLVAGFKAPIACPRCGSAAEIHRSRRRNWEYALIIFALRPYRCWNCRVRFWGPIKKLQRMRETVLG